MAWKRSSKVPWYSEAAGFFGPEYLKEYASSLPEERTRKEVAFLRKNLKLRRGVKILDCPCGHGRHSVALAQYGYEVTGQDLNVFFLAEARKAARRAGVKVRWVQGDMRQIPFESEFDVALNLFTAFGYLESDEEDQLALEQVARALKPGGRFVLDVMNHDWMVRNFLERSWQELSDGSVILTERNFDHVSGRNLETRTRISRTGKRETLDLPLRIYTAVELARMFQLVGLRVLEMYGDYKGKPLTFDSNRCIILAQKI